MASYGSVFLLSGSHIPHLLQELGLRDVPCKFYLVITIPHLKASDCFHVHFVDVLGCISVILI